MSALSIADLVGTWRVVRSEIPAPYELGQEFFHFTPEGHFLCEHPFGEQPKPVLVWAYHCEPAENGVWLSNQARTWRRHLTLRFDGELLVMTGQHHGYSSWLQRIPVNERPDFLTRFYKAAV